MSEPVRIIVSTAKEHSDYMKRSQAKQMRGGMFGCLIFLAGCGYGYYLLYQMVHP